MVVVVLTGVAVALAAPARGRAWPGTLDRAVEALGADDRAARLEALERLAVLPDGRPAIATVLTDPDRAVRAAAARALAVRGEPAAVEAAVRWISSGAPQERAAGLEVLRLTGAARAEAVRAAVRALGDGDAAVRLAALEVLAGADVRPVLPELAALLDDTTPAVRLRVVRLLAAARDPRAAVPLLGRLSDSDRQVQREAVLALGLSNEPRVAPPLLRLLGGGSDDLRLAATAALANLGSAEAVPALAAAAARRPPDLLAQRARRALGEIGTAAAIDALVGLLETPGAADELEPALLRIGPRAVPALLKVLAGGAAGPSTVSAARLLGRIGDPRAVGPLVALAGGQGAAATAALRALGELRAPASVPALVRVAADPSAEVRRLAFEALLAIGDDGAGVVVAAGLRDPDPAVRRSAVQIVRRCLLRRAAAAVAGRLEDVDGEVVREAVRALAAIGAEGVVGPIVASLQRLPGEEALVAEALATVARRQDVELLAAALAAHRGAARAALLAGLASALADGESRGPARGHLERIEAELDAPGVAGELAADALAAHARATGRTPRAVLAAFERARPGVRARLCPALVGSGAGGARLARALLAASEADEVRAAAAWALAGAPRDGGPRGALDRIDLAGMHPALAANVQAARTLAWGGSSHLLWLRDRAGRPLKGEWVQVVTPSGARIWGRTGERGQLRMFGLPADGIKLSLPGPELVLDDAGDAVGEVAGHQEARP